MRVRASVYVGSPGNYNLPLGEGNENRSTKSKLLQITVQQKGKSKERAHTESCFTGGSGFLGSSEALQDVFRGFKGPVSRCQIRLLFGPWRREERPRVSRSPLGSPAWRHGILCAPLRLRPPRLTTPFDPTNYLPLHTHPQGFFTPFYRLEEDKDASNVTNILCIYRQRYHIYTSKNGKTLHISDKGVNSVSYSNDRQGDRHQVR